MSIWSRLDFQVCIEVFEVILSSHASSSLAFLVCSECNACTKLVAQTLFKQASMLYDAYLLLCFAAAKAGDQEVFEWVRKTSSRIWRGPMGKNAWKYLQDGAWEPRPHGKRNRSRSGTRTASKPPSRKRSRNDTGMGQWALKDGQRDVSLLLQERSQKFTEVLLFHLYGITSALQC